MKQRLVKQCSSKALILLKRVGQLAQRQKTSAYIVGGVVRDLILKKPNLDLDIVVEGDALSLARGVQIRYKSCALTVYDQFKTATLVFPDGLRLDVATARKEKYLHPGALPVVSSGTIHDDLFRRDFTINALAIRINPVGFGDLVDFFGGGKDLSSRKIRILHERSFIDDPTRILRAVRFEQRLDFQIEERTLGLLKEGLFYQVEEGVKKERYFHEFYKIFSEQKPWKSIQRLGELKGFDFMSLGFVPSRSSLGIMRKIKDSQNWYEKQKGPRSEVRWAIVYLAALWQQLSLTEAQALTQRFNLNRQERKVIAQMTQAEQIEQRLFARRLSPSDVAAVLKPLAWETVFYLRSRASRKLRQRMDDYLLRSFCVQLSLTGHDLLRLGFPDGKRIGATLRILLDYKINRLVKTRKQELALARKILAGRVPST